MKDPLVELGSIIRTAREQLGISIDELALESRVSIHHIKNIEEANRSELPEETYLVGFLNRILKTLKINNASTLVNSFKKNEGDFIVQSLVNNNNPELDTVSRNDSYFKLYHVYIVIAVMFFVLICFVINRANLDNERIVEVKKTVKNKKPEKTLDLHQSSVLIQQGQALIEEIDQTKEEAEEEEEKFSYNSTVVRGKGNRSIVVRVKEVAWVQVIGLDDMDVLFEGDVFPSREPNQFKFNDNDGFVLASGNAGAFEVNTGQGFFPLGSSGQLIKWVYPDSARKKYERSHKRASKYKEQELVGI